MSVAAYTEDHRFEPAVIAARVGTTALDLARTAGLGRDAVQRRERIAAPKVQARLRELAELLARMAPRMGSDMLAYAWLRSEPLAGLDGLTAMRLLQDGHADWVHHYLDAVDAGVHA